MWSLVLESTIHAVGREVDENIEITSRSVAVTAL